ncbi:unnamed protein product [Paramecium pentaurelia]|uniref:Uncharacterized protein n=1 Tax=Paramecium pentaurelia TaxID=43138 RepID=A0A8S1TX53_9CILI|nr:unnamed protein product [Paramecium pentaurelia]
MEEQKINLINIAQPQIPTIFTCTKNTLIVDLHQYIINNYGNGKIEIYFTKNQPFSGNLNLYLQKQLKGSSVYYNIDFTQKSIHSSYGKTIQAKEQQSQSKSVFTPSQSKLVDQICQTEEILLSINQSKQMNQDQNLQQIASQQQQIQELKAKLDEKDEQMRVVIQDQYIQQKDLQNQFLKNKELIKKQISQINTLENLLTLKQNQIQLDQQQIEALKNKIEELKTENEAKNKQINQLMKQNDTTLQRKVDTDEVQQELILLLPQNKSDLFEFNDQETVETYANKCGHSIEKNILEQLLVKAIMNKEIAKCQICNSHFSSKLCNEIGNIGKDYLQMKSGIELPNIYKSCKANKNSHLNLISCENTNCKFFCFWKITHQKQYDDDYSFCPSCLTQSVRNPKGALFYTHT